MHQVVRPSAREVDRKIGEAQESLRMHAGLFANPAKAVGELYDLGLEDTNEVWILIPQLLEEIDTIDYAGTYPPQKSYEKSLGNQELFAFRWQSVLLKKEMYLKFALKDGRYYYVSLHASYPETKR